MPACITNSETAEFQTFEAPACVSPRQQQQEEAEQAVREWQRTPVDGKKPQVKPYVLEDSLRWASGGCRAVAGCALEG